LTRELIERRRAGDPHPSAPAKRGGAGLGGRVEAADGDVGRRVDAVVVGYPDLASRSFADLAQLGIASQVAGHRHGVHLSVLSVAAGRFCRADP
jgi:hypothetical protein